LKHSGTFLERRRSCRKGSHSWEKKDNESVVLWEGKHRERIKMRTVSPKSLKMWLNNDYDWNH